MSRFALLLSFIAPLTAGADTTVKLATLAPEGSTFHVHLKEIAEKWEQISGGKVHVKIYPGGVVGNESDMVRKLRVNQLQAAMLTGTGIHDIDPCVQSIQVPMVIDDNEELDYVLAKMAPAFEQILSDKGFVVLYWGDAGWVNFFTEVPVRDPAQMKDIKVFAWAGDEGAVEAWKIAGFKPVVISATDITTSLQTGLIEAVDTTPIFALSTQWYHKTNHMTNVRWAPLVGSLFISKKTWEQIPADLRPQLMAAAKEVGDRLRIAARKNITDAVATMQKDGLDVINLTPAENNKWRAAAEKAYPYIRQHVVPSNLLDEVLKYRDEYRKTKK